MGLTDAERTELVALVKGHHVYPEIARRAQMILWESQGMAIRKVAALTRVSHPTLNPWWSRYRKEGVTGLADRDRPGGWQQIPPEVRSKIVTLTRMSPPEELGISHWSNREMAAYLKKNHGIVVSHNFVSKLWREHGLKPHVQGTFTLSRDPRFAEKVADIVGLYLDPPDDAIVLVVDEKSQVQALGQIQPLLPISFGKTEKRTHDYERHLIRLRHTRISPSTALEPIPASTTNWR